MPMGQIYGSANVQSVKVEDHKIVNCKGKGFGSAIMDRLEEEIFKEYDDCYLDASLSAAIFYEHRGYRTVEQRKHDIGEGEVMIYEIMRKEKI